MAPDRELSKAEAVQALRGALRTASGTADAVRWCWYRHPMFAVALFTESVRHRFGPDPEIRNITSFLAGLRMARDKGSALSFPSREAEALIRAALGEVFLLESVRPDNLSYPEIGIAVLSALCDEGRLSLADWESLLERAQSALADAFELSEELALAENEWFAAGMHDSPFAALNLVDSGDKETERRRLF